MKTLLKLVRKLDDDELRHASEAIDLELSRRVQGRASTHLAGRNYHGLEASRSMPMAGPAPIPQKRAA